MPTAAPKPCGQCGVLVRDGTTRCAAHKRKAWDKPKADQGRGGRPWRRIRDAVLMRDAGLCQQCLRKGLIAPGIEVDHVVALADGGGDDMDNLQAICHDCHRAKTLAEALAARGTVAPRLSKACTAAGLPTDPRHPWSHGMGRGGEISTASAVDTDRALPLATWRNR